jgi:hypothetical protein
MEIKMNEPHSYKLEVQILHFTEKEKQLVRELAEASYTQAQQLVHEINERKSNASRNGNLPR